MLSQIVVARSGGSKPRVLDALESPTTVGSPWGRHRNVRFVSVAARRANSSAAVARAFTTCTPEGASLQSGSSLGSAPLRSGSTPSLSINTVVAGDEDASQLLRCGASFGRARSGMLARRPPPISTVGHPCVKNVARTGTSEVFEAHECIDALWPQHTPSRLDVRVPLSSSELECSATASVCKKKDTTNGLSTASSNVSITTTAKSNDDVAQVDNTWEREVDAGECSSHKCGTAWASPADRDSICMVRGTYDKVGPDFGFTGVKQHGFGPEMWAISLDQLDEMRKHPSYMHTKVDLRGRRRGAAMRDVVESVIKPETRGKGMGYALLKNILSPLRAQVMVSHAWDENYDDFMAALQRTTAKGPLWVCATAIYQPEDLEDITICKQLGSDPTTGPFATVLKQADEMVGIVTLNSNIYTRMWCVYEMFVALQLEVPVSMTQTTIYCPTRGYQDAFTDQCQEPACSQEARCGNVNDETSIRRTIEASPGGYVAVDLAVEVARLRALLKMQSQLPNLDIDGLHGNRQAHDQRLKKRYSELVIRVLGRIGLAGQAAMPYKAIITGALMHEDADVRCGAAQALSKIGAVSLTTAPLSLAAPLTPFSPASSRDRWASPKCSVTNRPRIAPARCT
eukprot:TRINITY_DN54917_c0_g1_i1.p1 TRINITY_DN54917_c0_g1~~TRINITY_DN54917_c0_g1_i1.p1  ORF type:complete len:627 (-),score=48.20 TRINITY_DN54917_c0_g1_i1:201-2081(-)